MSPELGTAQMRHTQSFPICLEPSTVSRSVMFTITLATYIRLRLEQLFPDGSDTMADWNQVIRNNCIVLREFSECID